MPEYRKLGRKSYVRKSMLRNMVSTLIVNGHIKTTLARAKEVQRIAEKLITLAVREANNYTTKEIMSSTYKLDAKNRKMLSSKTSKNGAKYDVVERQIEKKTVQVDNPSRLAARRRIISQVVELRDEMGNRLHTVNHLFNVVAPGMANVPGGYTKIVRLGQRRGDGAEMVILSIGDYEPDLPDDGKKRKKKEKNED